MATNGTQQGVNLRLRNLVGDFSLSAVGAVSSKFLALVTIPFVTRALGVRLYGFWDTVIILAGFGALLGRLGLDQATCHFIGLSRRAEEVRKYASTGFYLLLLTSGAAAGILFILLPMLNSFFFANGLPRVSFGLVGAMVLTESCLTFFYGVHRFTGSLRWYLVGMNGMALLNLLQVVALYHWGRLDLTTALTAYVISGAAVSIVMFWKCRGHLRGPLALDKIPAMLKFGIPLILSSGAFYVMNGADRFFLAGFHHYRDLGLYAIACKIAFVLNVAVGAFGAVWTPFAYKSYALDPQEAGRQFRLIADCYVVSLCLLSLALIAGANPLTRLLGGKEFSEAVMVVPLLLGAVVSNAFGSWFCLGIDFSGKSGYRAVGTLAAAGLNVLLNFLLIPSYGMMGAAIATFVAYWVASLVLMMFSQRLFFVPYRLVSFHVAFLFVGGLTVVRGLPVH